MKKKLLFMAVIAFSFGFVLNGQNLVVNGDFETGDFTGWSGEGSEIVSPGADGTGYCVRNFGDQPEWGPSCGQENITVVENTTYDVSVTAKWESATGIPDYGFKLTIKHWDEAEGKYVNFDPMWQCDSITATEWTTVTNQFTTPAGVTDLKIEMWRWIDDSPIFIDDVSIVEVIPPSGNIVVNGDFETGDFTGWSGTGSEIVSPGADGTGYCVRNFGDQPDWGPSCSQENITAEENTTYDVSVTAKWESPDGIPDYGFKLTIKHWDEAEGKYVNFDPMWQCDSITATEWTTVTNQFTTPAGVTDLKIEMWRWIDVPAILIDDVSMIKEDASAIFDFETLDASVYPNPLTTGSDLYVQLNETTNGSTKIELININGQVIYSMEHANSGNSVVRVGIQELSLQGIYLLRVTAGNKATVKKIIVK